ncbi:MAG: hypothetical protein EAZ92_12070 [Candidatus Kapaibacterium sp.]|nr:MAG: hypothetical protein EAZ92_12070 [Candidatus Kapabacteria bacterium]
MRCCREGGLARVFDFGQSCAESGARASQGRKKMNKGEKISHALIKSLKMRVFSQSKMRGYFRNDVFC